MPFTTPLIVQRVDAQRWITLAPLSYQGAVEFWTIPSGFVSDFASVPWWGQSLIPRTGAWTLAAVLHDWMCDGLRRGTCPVSPRDADGIFRRVLREEGVDPVRRWLMWAAVRWAAILYDPERRPGVSRDLPALTAVTTLALIAVVAVLTGVGALTALIL